MAKLKTLFTAHPSDVGESYAEHMLVAAGFGGRMVLGGMACLVHALFPFLFVRTGSRTIVELHERMTTRGRPLRPKAPVAERSARVEQSGGHAGRGGR